MTGDKHMHLQKPKGALGWHKITILLIRKHRILAYLEARVFFPGVPEKHDYREQSITNVMKPFPSSTERSMCH